MSFNSFSILLRYSEILLTFSGVGEKKKKEEARDRVSIAEHAVFVLLFFRLLVVRIACNSEIKHSEQKGKGGVR